MTKKLDDNDPFWPMRLFQEMGGSLNCLHPHPGYVPGCAACIEKYRREKEKLIKGFERGELLTISTGKRK